MTARGAVIALLGAESTGKTTLAAALGVALAAEGRDAVVVDEYLREFCAREGRTPRRDEQAGLFHRLADRALVDGLVDLEEAARLRPGTQAGLDATPDQDDLAGVRDRESRDHEARVDVRMSAR